MIYQELLHDPEHAELHSYHTDPVAAVQYGQEALAEDYVFGFQGNALADAEQHDIHMDDKIV